MGKIIIGDARSLDLSQFGVYGVIVADPPWPYRNPGAQGAASLHYDTMQESEISGMPVSRLAASDSVLYLWATWPKLEAGLDVVAAWGFEYITGFPWIKMASRGGALQAGIGYWIRGCTECVLLGRRGNVKPPPPGERFAGLLSPNLGHSRKPTSIHELAEGLPGPYLELFARRAREGWDTFGNAIDTGVGVYTMAGFRRGAQPRLF